MIVEYVPQGVCCGLMRVEIENNIVLSSQFLGGCNGNLQGISSLIQGMNVNDIIAKLQGIHCGDKPTSCPDQLANFLIEYLRRKNEVEAQQVNH